MHDGRDIFGEEVRDFFSKHRYHRTDKEMLPKGTLRKWISVDECADDELRRS